MMRSVAAALGLAFVAGPIAFYVQQRAVQRDDVREIAALRAELDSVAASLARAGSRTDSLRLVRSVEERKSLLGRREFHVPSRQEAIDNWWRPTGPGTVLAVAGVVLLGLAIVAGKRGRPAEPRSV